MFWAHFNKRRKLDGARSDAVRAAGFEGASGRKLSDWRDGAFDGGERKGAVGR
jgi:hypothetical protein